MAFHSPSPRFCFAVSLFIFYPSSDLQTHDLSSILRISVCACSVARLYMTLCNAMDCSKPGSSVHGIFQARIKWVAVSYSRGSSQPRDPICQSDPNSIKTRVVGFQHEAQVGPYSDKLPHARVHKSGKICFLQRHLLSEPVVHSLSRAQFFVTPWTAACQASLFYTISQSLLKLTSIESMRPSNHLILCHPLLFLPSVFPSIRVFSNESTLHIKWPKYWSFTSPTVLPMNIQG